MKTSDFIVRIPEPCNEDWNNMLPQSNGKFCSSCSKVVFDFSNKTDTEIRDLLVAMKEQKVCGHFKKTQVDRPLHIQINLNDLPRQLSSTKAFAIAVFVVFGTLLFSCTNNEGNKIGKIEIENKTGDGYTTGAPLPLPPDTLLMGDIAIEVPDSTIKGKSSRDTTETADWPEAYIAGGLSFEQPEPADTVPVKAQAPIETPTMGTMEGIATTTDSAISKEDTLTNRVIKVNQKQNVIEEQDTGLLVYPNPGKGEFTVSYQVVKRANIRVDLFDMQGAWLSTIVNVGMQHEGRYTVPVTMKDLPDGIYLVNMIKGGKRYTEKLIIEK